MNKENIELFKKNWKLFFRKEIYDDEIIYIEKLIQKGKDKKRSKNAGKHLVEFPKVRAAIRNQTKEECAKEAGENFDMDLYEKFCEENSGKFHSGHYGEREIVMEFIEEAIKRIK